MPTDVYILNRVDIHKFQQGNPKMIIPPIILLVVSGITTTGPLTLNASIAAQYFNVFYPSLNATATLPASGSFTIDAYLAYFESEAASGECETCCNTTNGIALSLPGNFSKVCLPTPPKFNYPCTYNRTQLKCIAGIRFVIMLIVSFGVQCLIFARFRAAWLNPQS